MPAKTPYWEVVKIDRRPGGYTHINGKRVNLFANWPWYARLKKSPKGRVIVETKTRRSMKDVLSDISIVDPDGKFEVVKDYVDETMF